MNPIRYDPLAESILFEDDLDEIPLPSDDEPESEEDIYEEKRTRLFEAMHDQGDDHISFDVYP